MSNVRPSLLIGDDFDSLLFRVAFYNAELGKNIWFISPQPFDRVPDNIVPPDKEILQLITFVYLKNHKDLITHMNGIHLWQKIPSMIILKGFEKYCGFEMDSYNSLQAALVTTSLLDSASACSVKKDHTVFLLITCSELDEPNSKRLQLLIDLYYLKVIRKTDNNDLFDSIISYYS